MSATGVNNTRLTGPICLIFLLPTLASCSGIQSALDPAGEEAEQVATLFWVMSAGGMFIWAAVVALSTYAARRKRGPISERAAGQVIVWAGVAFPVTVLTALLIYALWLMPSLRPFASAEQAALRIEVTGKQFWWNVVYRRADGSSVVSANEVRLPVGRRVEFSLASADMIHSFWIPALGGKMDMVPGRMNRLSLLATKTGTYRGQCAEFCGTGHARMAFPAIVMELADFEAWLDARAGPSGSPASGADGKAIFEREGCGKCHGLGENSTQLPIGPDLSHVGSRTTIGAGLLPNNVETLARFIANSASVKPGSQMPAYPGMSDDDLAILTNWLTGLK